MGKWEVEGRYFDYGKEWWIVDANGRSVLGPIKFPHDFPKPEIVAQIVREHNAHGDLLELARAYREGIQSDMDECDRPDLIEVYEGALKNIDAVLARAKGRE